MNGYHEERNLGKIYDHRLARRLFRYLWPYRWIVLGSVLLLITASSFRLVGPLLTEIAIDEHIQNDDLEGLVGIGQLYFAILVLQFIISFAQTYLTNWTGQKIMYDLRMEIFSHVQRLHLGYFDKNPVGRIITRMTTDVDVLNELFTSGVVSIFGDLVSLFGIVVIMLWMDWRLALVSFAVIPFLLAATLVFKRKVRGSYRRVRTAIARINAFLQENVTGMPLVQVFVQEERKHGEFSERNREHLEANLASIFYYAIYYPIVGLLGSVSIALILWYGGLQNLEGAVSLGVLVAFIQYAERFYKPISDLSEKFNILQNAMASSERIFDLLETKPEITTPGDAREPSHIRGEIEFRDVHFSYKKGLPVLHDINLKVRSGEKVAIVGATGSGKSTLINLLCRFYELDRGSILLDGVDIRKMNLDHLRRSIAVVLQDVFLFSGSVEENIRLWRKPITHDAMEEAAAQVHAQPFIANLSDGYKTEVSERGSSLSVGQRQLLAFARALAHDPRILILDEATSCVDTETETLIQDAVEKLMENHTSLIIAHRLSTIQHCDRIVVLHKGRIIEEGTHQQLLRTRGIYHKLYRLQYKDQLGAGHPPGHRQPEPEGDPKVGQTG